MPEENSARGITITARGISMAVGMVTLLGVVFRSVNAVNSYSYRLNKLESDKIELLSSVNTLAGKVDQLNSLLTTKVDSLNEKINSLTIALNRVQDRYQFDQERSGTDNK